LFIVIVFKVLNIFHPIVERAVCSCVLQLPMVVYAILCSLIIFIHQNGRNTYKKAKNVQ